MKTLSKFYPVLLILLSAVFALKILSHLPWQLDFTAQRSYTLSEGSKRILDQIESPIELRYYYSRSSEQAPTQLKNFGGRVEQLLQQYVRHAKGRIRLQVIDPKPDSTEEEAAIRAGVQGVQLAEGETFFMGLTASQAELESSIEIFTLQREPYLEYDISKLITDVQRVDRIRIGLLTGLPIEGSQLPPQLRMQQGMQGEPEWSVLSQLRQSYEVEPMAPGDSEAAFEGLDLLMVLHPKNLSETQQFAIDQFVLSGRPVLIAVDPVSVFEKQSNPSQQAMMGMGGMDYSSDLPALLKSWGITYDASQVLGDLGFAARVSTGMGQAVPYPVWLQIDEMSSELPALAPLQQLLLTEVGSFSFDAQTPKTGLNWSPILRSSKNAAQMDAMSLNFSTPQQLLATVQQQLRENDSSPHSGYDIAGLLTGTFHTAFPDGRPEPDANPSENAEEGAEEEPSGQSEAEFLKQGEGTVVLIADSDWLTDRFSVERLNFLGSTLLRPLNDNLSLALNLVDQFAGSPDLIALRGRSPVNRSFHRVEQLEIEAQTRYQEQLEAVNQRLIGIQSEISRIQNQQQSEGMLIASEELKQAIADFREQEANAIAERREIRKRLREDIEALNRNLILINLLLVPGLLTVFGIRYFRRRSRAGA